MKLPGFIICAVLACGCAAHPDPIIDKKGVDEEALSQDWVECEAYTEEVAIEMGIAKGSAAGAAVGAISGAIWGDVERGAANGALWGGTASGLDADRERQQIFKRCLALRGYRVLN